MRALLRKLLTPVWVTAAWVLTGFPGDTRGRRGRVMCWLIRVDPEKVTDAVDARLDADEYPSERST